jgi:ADP-heptose:LPS heptosyltransferase
MVPRRLLVVKVHGMGDAVLIRLVLEQLKSRHPEIDIGVLAGTATIEVLTLDSNFRIHMYRQKDLGIGSIIATFRAIRHCDYEAVLNFEQVAVAATAFLATASRCGHGEKAERDFTAHRIDEDSF